MIRERDIEKKVVELAKKAGWLAYKFVSPSQRGVPDRIFIRPGEPLASETAWAARIVFIEFKAPGKKPTQLQAQTIRKLRDAGCEVHVCDSVESACDALGL